MTKENKEWCIDVTISGVTSDQMNNLLDLLCEKVVEMGGLLAGGFSSSDMDEENIIDAKFEESDEETPNIKEPKPSPIITDEEDDDMNPLLKTDW